LIRRFGRVLSTGWFSCIFFPVSSKRDRMNESRIQIDVQVVTEVFIEIFTLLHDSYRSYKQKFFNKIDKPDFGRSW
jgi:hypothetical protein